MTGAANDEDVGPSGDDGEECRKRLLMWERDELTVSGEIRDLPTRYYSYPDVQKFLSPIYS